LTLEVEFSTLAAEEFRKMEMSVRRRIVRKLSQVAENPRRHIRTLRGIGAFTIRDGEYREVVDVDFDREIISVLTLGHRRAIYRR
jgi:mRNA interferase RelE/StbE